MQHRRSTKANLLLAGSIVAAASALGAATIATAPVATESASTAQSVIQAERTTDTPTAAFISKWKMASFDGKSNDVLD